MTLDAFAQLTPPLSRARYRAYPRFLYIFFQSPDCSKACAAL
jgi:hypothetical protein